MEQPKIIDTLETYQWVTETLGFLLLAPSVSSTNMTSSPTLMRAKIHLLHHLEGRKQDTCLAPCWASATKP